MLITSHRHKPKDLELWDELSYSDSLHDVDRRERQSRAALRTFSLHKSPYTSVSWGKDSVVVVHLSWLIDKSIPLVHLRPTNHNPDCDAVRDAYFAMCPGQPYEEFIVDYTKIDRVSTPHDVLDKLTDAEWNAAWRDVGKKYGQDHITGIRADESMGRSFRMFRWGINSKHASAPIGWWSTADVFAYLAKENLPVHPAYACLGGGRWERDRLRVAEIGDTHGTGGGRLEWEQEYYGSELRRLQVNQP